MSSKTNHASPYKDCNTNTYNIIRKNVREEWGNKNGMSGEWRGEGRYNIC